MKHRSAFILAAIFILSVLVSACSAAPSAAPQQGSASDILKVYPDLKDHKSQTFKVKRVVDGDTFETETKEKIRLIGVDTPETVKQGSPVEAYGKEASDYTKKRLTGQTVVVFTDTEDKDRYGRLLRYVFIQGETRMFNEELLIEGYANIMTVPPNVMYSKAFLKLERQAREQNKGLWGAEAASTPKSTAKPSN